MRENHAHDYVSLPPLYPRFSSQLTCLSVLAVWLDTLPHIWKGAETVYYAFILPPYPLLYVWYHSPCFHYYHHLFSIQPYVCYHYSHLGDTQIHPNARLTYDPYSLWLKLMTGGWQ